MFFITYYICFSIIYNNYRVRYKKSILKCLYIIGTRVAVYVATATRYLDFNVVCSKNVYYPIINNNIWLDIGVPTQINLKILILIK